MDSFFMTPSGLQGEKTFEADPDLSGEVVSNIQAADHIGKFAVTISAMDARAKVTVNVAPGGYWHQFLTRKYQRAADLPTEKPIAYELKAVQGYLAALDDPTLPPADFHWQGTSAARITATLRPEHLLSVQATFDRGWHASVNGSPRPIWGDKLGQIVVEPRCNGACEVYLAYDGGAETWIAHDASHLALIGGALWILLGSFRWRLRLDLATTK